MPDTVEIIHDLWIQILNTKETLIIYYQIIIIIQINHDTSTENISKIYHLNHKIQTFRN